MSNVSPIIPDSYLDGSEGPNRKYSPVFSAKNDAQALEEFICVKKSIATQNSYRRECERIMRWARFVHKKAFSSLASEDLRAYRRFIRNPPPEWCQNEILACRDSKGLFKGPLSEGSERYALKVIDNFFGFLVEQNYLHQKPLIHIEKRDSTTAIHRRIRSHQLSEKERQALFAHLDAHPSFESERLRFAIWMLFGLGLRNGELTDHKKHRMCNFEQVRGHWIFHVYGKGDTEFEQPVPPSLLDALVRWRRYLGKPDFPDANDKSPLIVSIWNHDKPIEARQLSYNLKDATAAAAELLEDEYSRKQMLACSPHWFRHMYVSVLANGKNANGQPNRIEDVKLCARHKKLETTAGYMGSDSDLRRAAVLNLSL